MDTTMAKATTRRHGISDATWAKMEPLLPGRAGTWGGVAQNNRQFVNAVFWVVRTGAPWRDLPSEYGDWSNTHRRFIRWRNAGVWERLLEAVLDEPDMEWLMADAGSATPRRPAAGENGKTGPAKGRKTPKFIWPLLHLVFRSESLSRRVQSLIAQKLGLSPKG